VSRIAKVFYVAAHFLERMLFNSTDLQHRERLHQSVACSPEFQRP